MAYLTAAKPASSLPGLIARPFVAFWNFLIVVAEAHPKMNAVNKLSEMTDEQLAERGTNRSDEVRRIFAGQFYL